MSILHTLNQTCSLYLPTIGANGQPGFPGTATTASVKCRIEPSHEEVQTGPGTQVIADTLILMDGTATVDNGYKVIDDASVEYRVLKARHMRGLASYTHWELICQEL